MSAPIPLAGVRTYEADVKLPQSANFDLFFSCFASRILDVELRSPLSVIQVDPSQPSSFAFPKGSQRTLPQALGRLGLRLDRSHGMGSQRPDTKKYFENL